MGEQKPVMSLTSEIESNRSLPIDALVAHESIFIISLLPVKSVGVEPVRDKAYPRIVRNKYRLKTDIRKECAMRDQFTWTTHFIYHGDESADMKTAAKCVAIAEKLAKMGPKDGGWLLDEAKDEIDDENANKEEILGVLEQIRRAQSADGIRSGMGELKSLLDDGLNARLVSQSIVKKLLIAKKDKDYKSLEESYLLENPEDFRLLSELMRFATGLREIVAHRSGEIEGETIQDLEIELIEVSEQEVLLSDLPSAIDLAVSKSVKSDVSKATKYNPSVKTASFIIQKKIPLDEGAYSSYLKRAAPENIREVKGRPHLYLCYEVIGDSIPKETFRRMLDDLCQMNLAGMRTTTYMGLPRQEACDFYSSAWYYLVRGFEGGRAARCEVCGTPMLVFNERRRKQFCGDTCGTKSRRARMKEKTGK